VRAGGSEKIGAGPYERNDSRSRLLSTNAGDVELAVPKLRHGSFFPELWSPRRRIDRALWAVIMEAFVHTACPPARSTTSSAPGHRRWGIEESDEPHLHRARHCGLRISSPPLGPHRLSL